VLLAFRQEKCREDTLLVTLPFAGDREHVLLTDEDTEQRLETSGDDAARQGITLRFETPRQARLLWIRGESAGGAVPLSPSASRR